MKTAIAVSAKWNKHDYLCKPPVLCRLTRFNEDAFSDLLWDLQCLSLSSSFYSSLLCWGGFAAGFFGHNGLLGEELTNPTIIQRCPSHPSIVGCCATINRIIPSWCLRGGSAHLDSLCPVTITFKYTAGFSMIRPPPLQLKREYL